jgi:hypothetical protein
LPLKQSDSESGTDYNLNPEDAENGSEVKSVNESAVVFL